MVDNLTMHLSLDKTKDNSFGKHFLWMFKQWYLNWVNILQLPKVLCSNVWLSLLVNSVKIMSKIMRCCDTQVSSSLSWDTLCHPPYAGTHCASFRRLGHSGVSFNDSLIRLDWQWLAVFFCILFCFWQRHCIPHRHWCQVPNPGRINIETALWQC